MAVLDTLALASIPAGGMFLFSLIGLGVHVPTALSGALQHFAAGILLCTIGTELLPTMQATGLVANVAIFCGFFLGVAVMLALGILLPEHDDDDHDHGEEGEDSEAAKPKFITRQASSRLGRGESSKRIGFASTARQFSSRVGADGKWGETQPLQGTSTPSANLVFPSTLVFAIAIDGAMDGLLIGIACAASSSAGPMLAASLTVEMAFLGLTLSVALKGHHGMKTITASLSGPVAILFGCFCGSMLADALSTNPIYTDFLLSFGTSALLFMVAEELLLEAHEDEHEHVWWVDLQLYTGFYASIIMGKMLG